MILYHFTQAEPAAQLLKEGRFRLSSAYLSDVEYGHNKKRRFFLSTTRTRRNYFAGGGMSTVIFELDGTRLRANYKMYPVNYWGDSKLSESEERLVSDVPYMPLKPYVKSIHVSMDKGHGSDYRKILLEARKRGIEVYIYATQKDLVSMQPSRRIGIPEKVREQRPEIKGRRPDLSDKPAFVRELYAKEEALKNESLRPYLTLLHLAKDKRWNVPIDREAAAVLKNLKSGSFGMRAEVSKFNRIAVNSYEQGHDTKQAKIADAMGLLAKQLGLTVDQILPYIKERAE